MQTYLIAPNHLFERKINMKKGLLLLSIIIFTASSALALPSYLGLRGLNRTVDAKPIGNGEFSVGLFSFLGLSSDTRTAEFPTGTVDVTDTEYDGTGFLTASIGLGDKMELAGRFSYVWNCLKRESVEGREDLSGGECENDDGFSEAHLFFKYSTNPGGGENLWIGIMPWIGFGIYDGGYSPFVINNNEYDGVWEPGQPMFDMRRPMIGVEGISAGADLLVSTNINPMRLHFNIGYHYYKQHFEFTDYRYTASHGWSDSTHVDMYVEDPVLHLAAGIEYPLNKVILFTEAEWRHFMKRDHEQGDGEDFDDCITISPGIRIPTSSGFAFDITGSFTLTDFDADQNDLGHSIYQGGGSPTSGDRAHYAPFPEGFSPEWGIGLNIMYSTDLREKPITAIMSGTVTDAGSGDFLKADVAFPGTAVQTVATDAETGFYSVVLPEGTVNVTVNADGYPGVVETVQIIAGQNISRNFMLEPIPVIIEDTTIIEVGQVLSFENIYFDFNSANIKRESYPILNEVVDILKANPNATIRITGHTDSDGSESYNQTLSEQRAASVLNYLVQNGIETRRLSTLGYGESQPVVPNTSPGNKAKNRRIEFIVLSN